MKKLIVGLALAAMSIGASAGELLVHTVSYHIDRVSDRHYTYNNINPGFGYRTDDGWMFGVFKNSYKDLSVYGAKEFMYNNYVGGFLGIGTGYAKHVEGAGELRPMVGLIGKLPVTDRVNANLLVMPNVLHLILSKKF